MKYFVAYYSCLVLYGAILMPLFSVKEWKIHHLPQRMRNRLEVMRERRGNFQNRKRRKEQLPTIYQYSTNDPNDIFYAPNFHYFFYSYFCHFFYSFWFLRLVMFPFILLTYSQAFSLLYDVTLICLRQPHFTLYYFILLYFTLFDYMCRSFTCCITQSMSLEYVLKRLCDVL